MLRTDNTVLTSMSSHRLSHRPSLTGVASQLQLLDQNSRYHCLSPPGTSSPSSCSRRFCAWSSCGVAFRRTPPGSWWVCHCRRPAGSRGTGSAEGSGCRCQRRLQSGTGRTARPTAAACSSGSSPQTVAAAVSYLRKQTYHA